jgi:hypothetical protein
LVIQGDNIPEAWPQTKGAQESTVFKSNPSGRVTEDVTLEWIQFFDRQTKDRVTDAQPRILLFRGEPLHLTFAFLEFCDQHNIIPLTFPLKMGHLMQSFELKQFSSYKDYWRPRSFDGVKMADADEEKGCFIKNFFTHRKKVLNPKEVEDAFASEGLFPLDPSVILDNLKK